MPDITEKDKIMHAILVALSKENFTISLLINGEAVVAMPTADYTIKLTRKKERII